MRSSFLNSHTNEIIDFIKQGMTQSSIARELIKMGYTGTSTNARMYVCLIAQKYELILSKYSSIASLVELYVTLLLTGVYVHLA